MMRIRELRLKAGKSQAQLAAEIGTEKSTVAKWEAEASYPRADKLPVIAEIFGCTIDDLFIKQDKACSPKQTLPS